MRNHDEGPTLKLLLYANSAEKARMILPWVCLLGERFTTSVTVPALAHAGSGEAEAIEAFRAGIPADRLEVRQVPPAEESAEAAIIGQMAREDYDLLILAPAGRRGLQRLLHGSMVGRVVSRVRGSVLIVRAGAVPPRTMLVCVSGSRHSLTNVRVASRLAVALGSRLVIMMALSQVPVEFRGEQESMRREDFLRSDHPLAAHLRTARELMEGLGAKGDVHVAEGMVVEEILRELEGGDHDLLVIGTHRAEDYDPMYEDVTSELIRRSGRTTLVVGLRAELPA